MITKDHSLFELEQRVVVLLHAHGPLTGFELKDELPDTTPLNIWKVCHQSNLFRITNSARYYLRYDILRNDQLRLSPSILRDFLTFSVISLAAQRVQAVEVSARLANKHRIISRRKTGIARQCILSLDENIRDKLNANACFFLSGDVAYYLAHEVPRVHEELKTTINGSDIDIIVVYNPHIDTHLVAEAERQFLKYKYLALRDPAIGEEIDFIFKPISKMIAQLQYRDIHEKIASKILYESFFLFGNIEIFESLSSCLNMYGTRNKIENDFETALLKRKHTIQKILALTTQLDSIHDEEIQSLFYFSQERLEFQ